MIALNDVKRHLNIDHSRDDTLIDQYIAGAIAATENYTGITIKQSEKIKMFDCFASRMELSTPLTAVIEITYYDADGMEQVLPAETYDYVTGLYGYLELGYGKKWPVIQSGRSRAVKIRHTAGYTSLTLPFDIKIALMAMIGQMYENREPTAAIQLYEVPMSYHYLLGPYKKVNI